MASIWPITLPQNPRRDLNWTPKGNVIAFGTEVGKGKRRRRSTYDSELWSLPFIMTDAQLLQLICAYRLLDEELELSLSTRESATYRDNVMKLGITSMSAGSKTEPGGYAQDNHELEQFAVSDDRSPLEVKEAIERQGYHPVWKDWDHSLGA